MTEDDRSWFRWPLSLPPRFVEWSAWHLPLAGDERTPACGAPGPRGQAIAVERQASPLFPRCVDCQALARRDVRN